MVGAWCLTVLLGSTWVLLVKIYLFAPTKQLTYPELEGDVLRLDLHRPLVVGLLLQVDVLDDAEDVVGVDHVLGRAPRAPRARLRRKVRLLVATRQRGAVH